MRVLMLFSDTGGGHRAAARAIEVALSEIAPDVTFILKDGLVEGGPWPLNRAPRIYAWAMAHARWTWTASFFPTNGPIRARLMADAGYPGTAPRLKKLLRDNPADVVMSDHPLLTRTVSRALRGLGLKVPFGIVVTDLVSGHWSWFDKGADRIFVPTSECLERIVAGGFPREKLELVGQPVHPDCLRAVPRRDAYRSSFGWTEKVVLVVGGGDGMGGLGDRVRAIARVAKDARIVAVCGRNEKLEKELLADTFDGPVEIKGFVRNLHELMAAADILVTKGGPGSIMEGCVAGLPQLIYDYLPGQEAGNIRFAEGRGFGRLIPDAVGIGNAVRFWLDNEEERAKAAAASRAAAIDDAAFRVARGILELGGR